MGISTNVLDFFCCEGFTIKMIIIQLAYFMNSKKLLCRNFEILKKKVNRTKSFEFNAEVDVTSINIHFYFSYLSKIAIMCKGCFSLKMG